MDEKKQNRALFYARQFADAIAPSNFVLTNPEVLRETLRSNGDNLVRGLDNLLSDLERGHGELSIRQTSGNFVIGREIATTPGKVVFRNELFELLQYNPSTEQVYRIPAADLPAVDQQILYPGPASRKIRSCDGRYQRGYTVFVVSWVNPGPALAEKNFEDYMRERHFCCARRGGEGNRRNAKSM